MQTKHDLGLSSVLARLAKGGLKDRIDRLEEDLGAEWAQEVYEAVSLESSPLVRGLLVWSWKQRIGGIGWRCLPR